MFDLIRGDVRIVRVANVFVVRMTVDVGFNPAILDGITVRLCPSGDEQAPVTGILRYHAGVDDRRISRPPPPPFRRTVPLSNGRRMIMSHVAVPPVVRALCAKTIGFQFVTNDPMTDEIVNDGVIVFRLPGGREPSLRYTSAPLSRP